MAIIDKQFLDTSWYGSRQMARYMQWQGHKCGRHRVRRVRRENSPPDCFLILLTAQDAADADLSDAQHQQEASLAQGLAISAEGAGDHPAQPGPPLVTFALRMHCRSVSVSISATSRCGGAFCISAPSWTGSAARSWLGGCRTAWRRTSVVRLCNRLSALDGWSGPLDRQPDDRTAVAVAEIRMRLPERI